MQSSSRCMSWVDSTQMARWWSTSSIGTRLKWLPREAKHFLEIVLSGVVVSACLLALRTQIGSEFVESSLKHVNAMTLVFGLWLFACCAMLTGWPPIKCLRQMLVLPFLRFGHHVCLIGVGATSVLLLYGWTEMSSAVRVTLSEGVVILTVGGVELQGAIRYCEAPDSLLEKVPAWLHIGGGILGVILVGRVLLRELQKSA